MHKFHRFQERNSWTLIKYDKQDQLDNPLTPNGTKAFNAYGVAGQTSYDANYFYTCIATNTWRRVALGSTY
jgi:hypothetical protein